MRKLIKTLSIIALINFSSSTARLPVFGRAAIARSNRGEIGTSDGPENSFIKPQARWPTGPRGPKGEKGEPSDYRCYAENESENTCNSMKYAKGAKLKVTPQVVNNSICGTTIAVRGPCFDDTSKITCTFHDPVKGLVQGEGYATIEGGIPTAHCVVPFLHDTGRITVDLLIGGGNNNSSPAAYSGYIWVVMPQSDVNAVFMNCETNNELYVSWTASHPAIIGAEVVDILIHAFDPTRKIWINLGVMASAVQNTGSTRVDISKFRTMINECVVLVSVLRSHSEVTTVASNDFSSSRTPSNAFCGGSIMSSFVHRVTSCEMPEYCTNWFQGDVGIMPLSENILPCPSFLSQAVVDSNFIEDENSDKVKLLRHFQPEAKIFRSRFGSANGVGQQCVYDPTSGKLIVGSNEKGSSSNRYNPDGFLAKTLHFIFDVVPFMACCYGTNDECDLYYERRAVVNHPYAPPHACALWGDPHITTCDLLTYHFQGVGEFWLMKSYLSDGTVFFGQVRMEKWPGINGVSVATAFALKDGKSSTLTIQPAKNSSKLEVLADGARIPDDPALMTQSFRGFSIVTISPDGTAVTVAFGSGITFQIIIFGSGVRQQKFLSLTAYVSSIHRGALKGLLGNFDGKPENDLITSDGTLIPAVPQRQVDGNLETGANLAIIHWSFGMKWAITSSESLFHYQCGKSSSQYFDPSFIPNVQLPNPDFASPECIQVCGHSAACLFDCVNVDVHFANVTMYMEVLFAQTVKVLLQNIVACPILISPENGFITGPYSGVANFGCDAGFSLIGPSAIQCINSSWSEPPPVCIKATLSHCHSLVSPVNGLITAADSTIVKFSCNQGYTIDGQSTLLCENGKWSAPPPICVSISGGTDISTTITAILPTDDIAVAANLKLDPDQLNSTDATSVATPALNMSFLEELASGVDVDVDVNVNFNIPGAKKAGVNKHRRSVRH